MPQEQDDLAWGLKAVTRRVRAYQHYDAYYDGDHRLTFASAKMESAFGTLFQAFSLNLCAPIVEAVTDRLMIETWGGSLGEQANKIWANNLMEVQADQLHLEAARGGDGFLIVWPDKNTGAPRLWPQESEHMAVRYDTEQPGEVVLAVKAWRQEDAEKSKYRVNIYGPKEVRKWITRDVGVALPDKVDQFIPYEDDGDTEGIMENPYNRVPVFHFATNAAVGEYGRSDLKNVVPIQDALNKSVADLLVGAEFLALPQRYATGVETEEDETTPGEPKNPFPFKAVPGGLWQVPSEDAEFGQFPAADLAQLIGLADFFKVSGAQVSGTPPHYLLLQGAEPPSGESLKVAESRLVKKVQKRMRSYGAVWTAAMRFALEIANERKEGDLEPTWENPETRDDKNEAETQTLKQGLGVSQRQSLSEMGYTDDEIERMKGEKDEDTAAIGNAMLASFDRGAPVSQAQGAAMGGDFGG